MYRRAIRTLFVAASLLLFPIACDGGQDTKAAAKGDDKKPEGGEKTEVAQPDDGGAVKPDPVESPQPDDSGAAKDDAGDKAAGDEAAVAAEAGADEGGEKDGGDGDKAVEPKTPTKTPKTPTKTDGDPKPDGGGTATAKINAKGLFDGKCKSCHGADGKGETTIGQKVNIPSLAKTSLSKAKIVSTIENGVPDTKMKGYKDKLSKEEIDAVADYVKKL